LRDRFSLEAEMAVNRTVTLPELMLVAGTRGLLGAGIGLLIAPKMADGERRAVGRALFLIGLATTIPLALQILGGRPRATQGVVHD
jgi:hypothetical protein